MGDLLHFSVVMQNAWGIELKKYCQILFILIRQFFLHGQNIGDNLKQVMETIEYYKISRTPGLVFIADFEKAFDKVQLEFIFKCLDYFHFGESLIKWVKVMYSNTRCKIVATSQRVLNYLEE